MIRCFWWKRWVWNEGDEKVCACEMRKWKERKLQFLWRDSTHIWLPFGLSISSQSHGTNAFLTHTTQSHVYLTTLFQPFVLPWQRCPFTTYPASFTQQHHAPHQPSSSLTTCRFIICHLDITTPYKWIYLLLTMDVGNHSLCHVPLSWLSTNTIWAIIMQYSCVVSFDRPNNDLI